MAKKLVIVESPAKARTIGQFLGKDYTVKASFGHVRDIPSSKLGIDVEKDFEPTYEIIPRAKKIVRELKTDAVSADELYLATDLDREGEAIAWHLLAALGINKKSKQAIKRITFHEITRSAIEEALQHPKEINQNLVDAQQARRILDRLVGYKLSPLLWKKVYRGLSAGRVQSVAVRLVVEREREIQAFKVREYWTIEATIKTPKGSFRATLVEKGTSTPKEFKEAAAAQKAAKALLSKAGTVESLNQTESLLKPQPPLITSTLQQMAARILSFSAKRTMKLAQDLYEGIEGVSNGDAGGLITYMRTDSHQLSDQARNQAMKLVESEFGKEYVPTTPNLFAKKVKGAQEAHEAIRPTDFNKHPDDLSGKISSEHLKLYKLVYQQALASQMAPARVESTVAGISVEGLADGTLLARGRKLLFDGFLKAANFDEDRFEPLPELTKGQGVKIDKVDPDQHFTEPPARYSEASLVKELEKRGIGRPSTYAPTMSTIVERGYVQRKAARFFPEQVAFVVTDLLVEHFPEVVSYDFTAKMEDDLDEIAEGKMTTLAVLKEFYEPFAKNLAEKEKMIEKKEITEEKTDEKCPKCQKPLVVKLGRFGQFFACTGFPECSYTASYLTDGQEKEKVLVDQGEAKECPECKSPLQLKQGRFGAFWGCSTYPKCKHTEQVKIPSEAKCPNCGEDMLRKTSKRGKVFWGCAGYPKCQTAFWDEPTKEKCPKCQNLLLKKSGYLKCSQCDYRQTPTGQEMTE